MSVYPYEHKFYISKTAYLVEYAFKIYSSNFDYS